MYLYNGYGYIINISKIVKKISELKYRKYKVNYDFNNNY